MVLKFDFRSTTRSGLQSDVAACPKGAMNGLMGSYSNILALLGVTAYTKKKGRLHRQKRPLRK